MPNKAFRALERMDRVERRRLKRELKSAPPADDREEISKSAVGQTAVSRVTEVSSGHPTDPSRRRQLLRALRINSGDKGFERQKEREAKKRHSDGIHDRVSGAPVVDTSAEEIRTATTSPPDYLRPFHAEEGYEEDAAPVELRAGEHDLIPTVDDRVMTLAEAALLAAATGLEVPSEEYRGSGTVVLPGGFHIEQIPLEHLQ